MQTETMMEPYKLNGKDQITVLRFHFCSSALVASTKSQEKWVCELIQTSWKTDPLRVRQIEYLVVVQMKLPNVFPISSACSSSLMLKL